MRYAYLDEFGRVVMGDARETPGDGPAARKAKRLMDEARAGVDPDKCYALDPRWAEELELVFSKYMAGGLGDLEDDPELRAFLDELEGWRREHGKESTIPEELMRRYVELTFARRLSPADDAAD